MSLDDEKPAPALEQDTGLQKQIAQAVSDESGDRQIKILGRLDKFYVSRILHGENDPASLAKMLSGYLSPDEFRLLMSDSQNRGLYSPSPEVIDACVRMAAWREETQMYSSFVEDFTNYVFVRHYGNKAVVLHWNNDELVHQSASAFKQSHMDRFVAVLDPETGEFKRRPLGDAWLHSTVIQRYERAEFHPGKDVPSDILNLWRGWPYEDTSEAVYDSSKEPPACELFLAHMRDNMCGGDLDSYYYLLAWMADALQNPHRTSRVAVVLNGPQGSGKSLFATCFAEMFAPHAAVLSRPEQLTGQFNKHLMDKCVVFADEAFFAGNKKDAAALKTLVTSDTFFVEPKGVDGFMAPKRFRLIMASNDEHVIRAEADDRRYFVLRVDAGENNNSSSYFKAILDEWREGGRRALFHWLRGAYWRDVVEHEWSPEERPKTRALELQKDLSLDAAEMAVLNMLREGEPPCSFLVEGQGIFIPTRMMAEAVRLGSRDEKNLGEALRIVSKRTAGKPVSIRRMIDQEQKRGFILPSLAEARQLWEAHQQRKVDWPSGVEDWAIDASKSGTPF